jgi:hypothetical protein
VFTNELSQERGDQRFPNTDDIGIKGGIIVKEGGIGDTFALSSARLFGKSRNSFSSFLGSVLPLGGFITFYLILSFFYTIIPLSYSSLTTLIFSSSSFLFVPELKHLDGSCFSAFCLDVFFTFCSSTRHQYHNLFHLNSSSSPLARSILRNKRFLHFYRQICLCIYPLVTTTQVLHRTMTCGRFQRRLCR